MAVAKKGKKKWFQVVAPGLFRGIPLGESYVYDVNSIKNKKLKINLSKLVETKKHNAEIVFRVNEIKDNVAYTEVRGYSILDSYLKRILRPGNRKVSDSSIYENKDKLKIRVQFVLITKGKPNKSVLSNLRKRTKEYLTDYLKKKTYEEFIRAIISASIQKEMKHLLKKTYPVSFCEFSKVLKV